MLGLSVAPLDMFTWLTVSTVSSVLGGGPCGSWGEPWPCGPPEGRGEVTPLLRLEMEDVGVSKELGLLMWPWGGRK